MSLSIVKMSNGLRRNKWMLKYEGISRNINIMLYLGKYNKICK